MKELRFLKAFEIFNVENFQLFYKAMDVNKTFIKIKYLRL